MANKIEEIADKHFPVDPPLKSGYRNPEQQGAQISAKAALRELLEACCAEVQEEIAASKRFADEFSKHGYETLIDRALADKAKCETILARLRKLGGE